MRIQVWEDFSKLPKFKSYKEVPLGYEIVLGAFRSYPAELHDKLKLQKEDCAVALWGSTGMPTEDLWDEEIKQINEMQSKIGELSDKLRAVRCQIASYDMMHYNYSRAIANLLEAIKTGEYKHTAPIGWYIPWRPANQTKRVELLEVYISFLRAWEQKQKSLTIRTSKQYKNEILRNIYVKLGEWSAPKRNYVMLVLEKLESFRSIHTVPEAFWTEREKAQYDILAKNKLDQVIKPIEVETKKNRTEDAIIIRIEGYDKHIWYHSFFNEVDLWLDQIGKGAKIDFEVQTKKLNENIINTCTNFGLGLTQFLQSTKFNAEPDKGKNQYYAGLKKILPLILRKYFQNISRGRLNLIQKNQYQRLF